jgi:hypothetical protein
MRYGTLLLALTLTVFAQAAMAGAIIPMPSAGLTGVLALAAAVGAVGGITYLRNRRK